LSKDRLIKQVEEIQRINDDIEDFHIFSSIECNINSDGSLDIQPEVMGEVDFITGSVHSKFSMSENEMTERIINAMENEKVKVIAHPTGRLLHKREAYKVNLDRLCNSAKDSNVFFEINSFPDRLDLNDSNIKFARERGARFVISTDSHNPLHLMFMRFGVSTARRGWLQKKDVINALPAKKIGKLLTS
jgi:DNA polymerase (family 10)